MKKHKNNILGIAPTREDIGYRFIQWNNHHVNLQAVETYIDLINQAEIAIKTNLVEIQNTLQQYSSVKLVFEWDTENKITVSWLDKKLKFHTILMKDFLEAIQLIRPDRDKLTDKDLLKLDWEYKHG